jgi:hypothetical protein
MAFIYTDSATGNDADDGSTWALAKLTINGGSGVNSIAAPGDQVFCQDSISGGYVDVSTTGDYTLGPPSGTINDPVSYYACKSGTTNEGVNIVAADLVTDRNDTDIANIGTTFATGSFIIPSATNQTIGVFFYGFKITADADIRMEATGSSGRMDVELLECILDFGTNTGASTDLQIGHTATSPNAVRVRAINTDMDMNGGSSEIQLFNSDTQFQGGAIIGTSITGTIFRFGVSNRPFADALFIGYDFSAATSATHIVTFDNTRPNNLILDRCKKPTTITNVSGTLGESSRFEMVATDDLTDHTALIADYLLQTRRGVVEQDTTVIRTGGSNFSYKLTPATGETHQGIRAMYSPWMPIWVGTSDTDVALYLMEQTLTATLSDAEAWMEVQKPNQGVGTAGSNYQVDMGQRNILPDDSTNYSTDGSTWGGGGNQTKWKLNRAIAPEYEGPLFVRLAYAPGSTQSMFLDTLPEVT